MGRDTVDKMIITPELITKIRKIFPDDHYEIVMSRFRSAIKGDTYLSFIHADCSGLNQGWHILIYLTKNSEEDDGLVFYKHKEHGEYCNIENKNLLKDSCNFDKFDKISFEKYEYNSAIVVDDAYFHAPLCKDGFGDCVENSRLIHIIEVVDTRKPHYKQRISV